MLKLNVHDCHIVESKNTEFEEICILALVALVDIVLLSIFAVEQTCCENIM